ncbi:MAG: prephenate dehydratase [Bacteroidota bacterium]
MKLQLVSYQGEPGAFSEKAALAYFGPKSIPVPRPNFRDVFDDVARRRSSFGIIPIENSLFGSIAQNYDLLWEYPLAIVGEIKVQIHHCLMVMPGVSLKDVRHVYSHPQAIGQCEVYLRSLKNATVHQFYDTAGAAKMIADEHRIDSAAIASEQAARHYGLTILRKNIETDHRNYTRFVILSKKSLALKGSGKTSLLFATKHVPGSLVRCLSAFAERDINIEKIESRPITGKPWEYIFYLDINADDHTQFLSSMRALRKHASYVKILGSYSQGKVNK